LKKRILIFYDHFYPSYKAGGPTQSLVNIARELYTDYNLYIVCKPHERGETILLPGITPNHWTEWEGKAKVYYWQYELGNRSNLQQLIYEVAPDVVYVNGIYSLYLNFFPLWYAVQYKNEKKAVKIVLAARGMLHDGALSQKSLKKKLYLFLFKMFGLHKKVCWHATDEREATFIKSSMGNIINVKVAANFPNFLPITPGPAKKGNELFLGTVALISPMKNHLAVLQALQHCTANVHWAIFGPIKDETYWKTCTQVIEKLPPNIHVTYKGELPPPQLKEAMQQFQVFIMPSKSENFGHAIMEALSAGKPVITTTTTPFADLEKANCGFAIDPDQLVEGLQKSITAYALMNAEQFAMASTATHDYLSIKSDVVTLRAAYHSLFN
jgi:glycosyltransferase involved in cell wall biosynthesis